MDGLDADQVHLGGSFLIFVLFYTGGGLRWAKMAKNKGFDDKRYLVWTWMTSWRVWQRGSSLVLIAVNVAEENKDLRSFHHKLQLLYRND